jgi:branched-chain amino acid transport system permease protein
LLALVEGAGAVFIGPAHATTLSFALLIAFLIARPQGLLGRKGFE